MHLPGVHQSSHASAVASARTVIAGPRFAPYPGGPPILFRADVDVVYTALAQLAEEIGGSLADDLRWSETTAGRELAATLNGSFANRHILFAERTVRGRSTIAWTGEIILGVRDPRPSVGGFCEAIIVAKLVLRVEALGLRARRVSSDPFLSTCAVEIGRVVYKDETAV